MLLFIKLSLQGAFCFSQAVTTNALRFPLNLEWKIRQIGRTWESRITKNKGRGRPRTTRIDESMTIWRNTERKSQKLDRCEEHDNGNTERKSQKLDRCEEHDNEIN
ncbi:hypothetical protein QE152_g25322 [Popillia japonica]|uniref:Secreted protein n=1 Tax=Popillia japonica TaxID=7064 RepID=A0AAW1K343_POPJA